MHYKFAISLLPALLASTPTLSLAEDFGMQVQALLTEQSQDLFGIAAPLDASAPRTDGAYRTAEQTAGDQVLVAEGLTASYLTRDTANDLDMFALYPAENPTHLVACIEGGREEIAGSKLNPSVQTISLADGAVRTIVRGMDRCDGIRTTAWGTVLATEETDDGAAYEILDPLNMVDVSIEDRADGRSAHPELIARRGALMVMAWEGLDVLANGVVIGGDELRPGSSYPDTDGGGMFKFVPATPFEGTAISSLDESPLVAGTAYALRVSCTGGVQYGQGCEVGHGAWIEVDATMARISADLMGATGYYRPEDLHIDPVYAGEGVRFCWTNTGNKGASNFGEVICGVDSDVLLADAQINSVMVNRFIEGDSELNAPDNFAFHPVSGLHYVVEDNSNGDIWACLRDGADRDIKSDGCVRILSVKDSSAEPTGFMFSADGSVAYVSIQHSDDELMPLVDDYATDDLLIISGFSK